MKSVILASVVLMSAMVLAQGSAVVPAAKPEVKDAKPEQVQSKEKQDAKSVSKKHKHHKGGKKADLAAKKEVAPQKVEVKEAPKGTVEVTK